LRTLKITVLMLSLIFLPVILPTPGFAAQTDTGTPDSVIIFWTDGPKLKAVNLTFFPDRVGPIGIVSVPVYTWLDSEKQETTVSECYYKYGRDKLIRQMEDLFKTSIGAYITIDQQALVNVSDVIGSIEMAGRKTTLRDVFEGNYIDGPVNLQVEIRQLADALLTPAVLLKLPEIIWIFCRQIDSNIGPQHVMAFYHVLRYRGSGVLQKKAVPGRDCMIGNRKYRRVEPDTWSKTLKEVTS